MKLNVGSGKKYDPEYENIDLYDGIIADKKMSAFQLDYSDNSFEEVKAIQLIEHLGFFKSLYALSEWFRVLEFDGKLIIETPDLETAFHRYLNSNFEKKKEILGWIFGIPHKGLQHKLCYPLELLVEIIEKIGFINIEKKRFFNAESIPTLRIECEKPSSENILESYQILTHIRKILLDEGYINFKDSFITKEQEDLLTLLLNELIKFEVKKEKADLLDFIKELMVKSPEITRVFLDTISNRSFLSNYENKRFNEIVEILIRFNFPSILLNALKDATTIPGSQQLAFSSINSFGRKMIEKALFSKEEIEKLTTTLKDLFKNLENNKTKIFSLNIIKRKSLDYFYNGIKQYYEGNYSVSKKNLLSAIQMYRDDFLYYWNFAKVLIKANKKAQALKFYKRTLRLLRRSQVINKKDIKNNIKREFKILKKSGEILPHFEPVISLDKYHSNK